MITARIYLSDSDCVAYYAVSYKLQSEAGYIELPNQFTSPIVVSNLTDDTNYDIRIIKHCCDGSVSHPLDVPFLATILTPPTTFEATAGDSQVACNWDDMADADNYIVEMDTNSDYSTATEIYSGAVSGHTETELSNGILYYFRVKQQRDGYPDSEWSTASATPTL